MSVTSSSIEWTDSTWNPVRGCSRVSEGCRNCYAEKIAARFSGPGKPFEGFARQSPARWTGKVALVPEALDQPLRWRQGRRIFVNSTSDLFHENLPDEAIAAVFGAMAIVPGHTFQILTKRPGRMREWLDWAGRGSESAELYCQREAFRVFQAQEKADQFPRHSVTGAFRRYPWPLPNVWLGVSVEDQATADERIPLLLRTPAAHRFVSYEPALGPVDFGDALGRISEAEEPNCHAPGVDWLIVGGESGPGARPCDVAWIRCAVRQCKAAGVPVFVKQLGARPRWDTFSDGRPVVRSRKGGDPAEWPEDLRVREVP